MAQLKDTIVSGNLRVTDTTLTDTLHVTTIKAPTSSGGTTYGPGTNGQILKSNGTMTYWADMPTIPTVNNASLTLKGAGTTVTTFTANSSTNQSLDIVAGTNVTITPDATNHKITISSSYTNTDTKVNVKLATTSQAYLLGTTTIPTAADTGVTSVADTGVYLTTTAGELCATKFMTSGKNGYYTHDADNTKFPLVYSNATNLWVGAEGSTSYPHKGETFISAGWLGTLPTTSGETLTGNSTIRISVPKYTAGSSGGTWSHTGYYVLHSGNTSFTQSLSSGTKIGSIKINGSSTDIYAPTNTNTTYTFATGDAVGQFKVTPSGGSPANYNVNGINAGTNSGTANHLAYYSAATTIDDSTNIIYSVEDSTASTPRSRTILHLVGNQTVGNEATQLVGGVKGVLSYGDGGPQINFSTSATIGGGQDSSIIWTDNNSAAYGASWHFVSKETDWNVISKRFHARTGISIGTEVPPVINSTTASNTSNLYVVGTSQFNGTTTISTSDFGTQLIVERSGNPYYASLGFQNSLGMLGYIGANAVDANLYHIYAGDTSKQYIILDTGNTSITTTGSGNAITALSFSNGTFTATKGSTFIPLTGSDDVTGNIKITKASGETGFYAKRSDTGVEILMGVGAGGTNHGIYSNKLGKWMMYGDATNVYLNGNATTATTATKVATTVTNGTENTARYGIAFVADPSTSNAQAVLKNYDFRFNMTNGTDETGNTGRAEIVLGNNTPSGTAGNKNGILTLYSTGSYYGNLNNGTLTANRTHTLPDASGTIKLEKRSMMYDDTSDWASYSWHKFAEITSSTNYDDKAITFLVSRTYDTEYSGILSVHVRMNGSKNYQKHQFKWLIADENINPNNFVLVYTNNGTTSCKIELWYKQSQIYEGWIFEVLKEHTRMASENAWTVYTTSGHGSATYTAGTNHHASELACVQSKTALYAVKGTHTTTTNAWTGKIDANVLYDGMTIAYYLPYAVSPSANVTLNLTLSDGTTTGAINCYQNNTTRITTHYGAGSTIILTYWSAGSISVAGTATTDNRWTRCDYNSNSNVTQTNTTTSASYRVIFSGNANDTSETTTVRKSTNLQFNPSTATLSIGKDGTTQGSLVFNNSEGGHATLKSNSKGTSPTFLLPDTGGGTHTLSTGMYDLSVAKGSLTVSNVDNIPAHTMTFKIVFKSDSSTPIYSMIEIPDLGNNKDYSGLIQVGTYGDGSGGSPRVVMKAVIVKITAGSVTGTRTFTATVSPTQKISGSSVSEYTRNVSIEKIYACT